jgi:hypothetical protein
MKRFILVIFALISLNSFAQLQVKEGSFKYVPGGVIEDKQEYTDGNDLPMALIKISTENISEQERMRLVFTGNRATQIIKKPKTGQMWIYISAEAATFIDIKHPDYGTCKYYLPEELCDYCVYEMVLQYIPIVTESDIAKQLNTYLIIKTDVEDVDVYIDGEYYGQTPSIIPNMMSGEHKMRLSKTKYYDIEKTIIVENGETMNINEKMQKMSVRDLRKDKPKILLGLNMAYSIAPELSYGLTVGQFRKVGWYVSAMSNFKSDARNSEYECGADGRIDGDIVFYNGERTSSRMSVGAGTLLRLSELLYLKAGLGFGIRDMAWQDVNMRWIKNTYYSYKGMELNAGMVYTNGMMNASCEAVMNLGQNGPYLEMKLGIGINF